MIQGCTFARPDIPDGVTVASSQHATASRQPDRFAADYRIYTACQPAAAEYFLAEACYVSLFMMKASQHCRMRHARITVSPSFVIKMLVQRRRSFFDSLFTATALAAAIYA